ncbi:hypothetical protein ACTFDM_00950, partial [Campylobacter jejuni]
YWGFLLLSAPCCRNRLRAAGEGTGTENISLFFSHTAASFSGKHSHAATVCQENSVTGFSVLALRRFIC